MGNQFVPFFIVMVVLIALWWLVNGPQRRFLKRQSEISSRALEASQRQAETNSKYLEYLAASRAASERQADLLERIATALERNVSQGKPDEH